MTDKPDALCVLVAVDGETVLGFIISTKDERQHVVNVHQFWYSTDEIRASLLTLLKGWVESIDRKEIHCFVEPAHVGEYTNLGFKPYVHIMRMVLGMTDQEDEILLETNSPIPAMLNAAGTEKPVQSLTPTLA
jgi:hypothetical protein